MARRKNFERQNRRFVAPKEMVRRVESEPQPLPLVLPLLLPSQLEPRRSAVSDEEQPISGSCVIVIDLN